MAAPTFGILHDFRRPLPNAGSTTRYYAECLEEVAEADQLGFDAVWMSEHHFTSDGLLPSPLVMAAAIAARTRRIRIGTNILVLPLHHPLRVAEDAAVADLISGGRLVLGVGQGYADKEFAAFGADRRQRGRLLEEGVELLRQAWDSSSTRPQVSPRPERRIPIYVGGVTKAGLRRAARIGDALIVYCATPADLRARRALIDQIAPQKPLVCTSVLHVAATADQAWIEAEPGIGYLEGQIAQYAGRSELPKLARADYLVGTVDEVAQRLIALHHDVRFTHFAAWARLPGLSHTRSMETLRLLATDLIPTVTAQLT